MKNDEVIKNTLLVLEEKTQATPVEIQNAIKQNVALIQVNNALKQLLNDKIVLLKEIENNKFYSILQSKQTKQTKVNVDKGGRDVSKYKFNGVEYGKSRLAHAIISFYVKKNKPTFKQLCDVFPVKLIPPYGLISRKKEALEVSKDRARFFIKEHEQIELPDGLICVSNQFTKDRIDKFVLIVQESLGYVIG